MRLVACCCQATIASPGSGPAGRGMRIESEELAYTLFCHVWVMYSQENELLAMLSFPNSGWICHIDFMVGGEVENLEMSHKKGLRSGNGSSLSRPLWLEHSTWRRKGDSCVTPSSSQALRSTYPSITGICFYRLLLTLFSFVWSSWVSIGAEVPPHQLVSCLLLHAINIYMSYASWRASWEIKESCPQHNS